MEPIDPSNKYRPNVAAIVINAEGLILACSRSDFPECWQVPQGGLEAGETAEEGLRRELHEEIGVTSIEIIGEIPFLIRYDWPEEIRKNQGGYIGQEQHYFLVRLLNENEIRFDAHDEQEFSAVEWVTVDVFLSRLHHASFKKAVIEKAVNYFKQQGLLR